MRYTTYLLVLSAIFCVIYGQSTTCPPGQFFNATQRLCMNCTMGCANCFGPSPKECLEFQPGFILGPNNNVLKCGDACQRCEPSDLNRCIGCKAGWNEVIVSSTQKNCTRCSTPNCAVCLNDTASCDRCILGYNLDSDKNCKMCPDHCKICDERSNCKLCEDKFYLHPNMYCVLCDKPNCAACDQSGACQACAPGFSMDLTSGNCTKCNLNGCLSCSQNYCRECAPGYILNNGTCQTPTTTIPNCGQYTATGSRCVACKLGFFQTSDGKCQACDASCQQCTGPTSQDCLTCNPGKFLLTNPSTLSRICVSNCSTNSATNTLIADPNTGTCRACPFSCATCNDVESCDRCLPGFTPLEVDTVINGIPRKVKKCMPCHATCRTCIGVNSSQCLECQPGLNKTEADSVSGRCFTNTNCGEGFFYNNMTKSCSPCSTGCKACKSNTVCDRCQDGLFNNKGVCTSCPSNCHVCKSESFCLVCPPGMRRSVVNEDITECLSDCPAGHRVVETPDFDLDADSTSTTTTTQTIGKDTPCGKFLWRVGRVLGLFNNYVSTGKILPPDALDRFGLSTGTSFSNAGDSTIPDDPFSVIKQYTANPQFRDYVVEVTLMTLIGTTSARYSEQIAKIDSAFLSANGIDVNSYIGNIINEQNQELIQSFWQVLSNGTSTAGANLANICPKLPFKPSELFTFNFQRFFKELDGVKCFVLPSLDKAVSWGQDLLIANQRALDSNTDGEAAPKQIYEMLNNIAKQFNFNPQCHGIDLPKTSEWKTFIGGLINVHITYNIPFEIFFPFFKYYFRYKQLDSSNKVNQACVPCKFNCSECPRGWFRMGDKGICNAQCPPGYTPNQAQMTCNKETLSNLQVNIVWLSQSLLTQRQEQLTPLTLRAAVLGSNTNEPLRFHWDIEGDDKLRSKIFTSSVVRHVEFLKIHQFDWLAGLDQVTFKVTVNSSATRSATHSIVVRFSPPPTFSIDNLNPPSGSQIMLRFNGEIPADTLAVILVRLESAVFKISTQVEIKESVIPIQLPQVSRDTVVAAFIKSPSTTFEYNLNFTIIGQNLTAEQVKDRLNERVNITSSTDASNAVTETIDQIQTLKDQDKNKEPTGIKDDDPNKEILTDPRYKCDDCENKGVCKIDGGRKFCVCPKEWKGRFCEVSAETSTLVNERVSEIAEQMKNNVTDGDAANKIMIVSQLKEEADSFNKENRQKLQEIFQDSLKDLTQQIKEQKRQSNSNTASDVAYDPQQDGFDPSKLGQDQTDATSGFIPKEVVLAALDTVTQLIKSCAAEAIQARLQKEVTKELSADTVLKTLAREQSLAAENFKQLIGTYVLTMQSDSDRDLDIGEAKARFEKILNNGTIPKIFLTLLQNPSGKRMLDEAGSASVTILSTELINSGAQATLGTMPASSVSALSGYDTLASGDQVYTVGFYMDNGEEVNFAGAPNAYQLTVPCSSDVSTEFMCSEIDTSNNRIHGTKSVESYDAIAGQCTCSLGKAGMFGISYVEDPAPPYPGYSSGSVLALPLALILALLAMFI